MSAPEVAGQDPSLGLAFYLQEAISPVHQDISDLERHLQVRESLYRLLGLPRRLFSHGDVLEVGAGSGHNSLFFAATRPRLFHVCEPNPLAVAEMEALFDGFAPPHLRPTVYPQRLEEFEPGREYDIVICEGWLGTITEYEREMLLRLARLVAPGGALVTSFYPPLGGFSTYLRRLLGYRIIDERMDLAEKTEALVEALGPHLDTLPHLSRSHAHWVQDSILNPHIYVGLFSPETALRLLSPQFQVYGSVPRIGEEWRWYKSLFGEARDYNARYLEAYYGNLHNLFDYRFLHPPGEMEQNRQIEERVIALVPQLMEFEKGGVEAFHDRLGKPLYEIVSRMPENTTRQAFLEALELLGHRRIRAADIATLANFAPVFGREQCYLSYLKEGERLGGSSG